MASSISRSVTSLPLTCTVIQKLQEAGFNTVQSLETIKPLELMRELGCSTEEAMSILNSIKAADENVSIASAKVIIS